MIECHHKLYDRLYESVGKINHLIEKGSFEKIWLDENVCIEVFKYKGESQIHIRHTDEGVMLTKTHWENLVWLMQKYAKNMQVFWCIKENNGSAHAQGKQYKKT